MLCFVCQVLLDFELFANSTMPRDKASDLVLLEADLQQAAPQLPGAVSLVVFLCERCLPAGLLQWDATCCLAHAVV